MKCNSEFSNFYFLLFVSYILHMLKEIWIFKK